MAWRTRTGANYLVKVTHRVRDLHPGQVVLASLGSGSGREQSGRRPVFIVSSFDHLELVDQLVTVVPCTKRNRNWPNHELITGVLGLSVPTYAMTEQIRTIDRVRLLRDLGTADEGSLTRVMNWVDAWHLSRSA